jgi:hypothetical protein
MTQELGRAGGSEDICWRRAWLRRVLSDSERDEMHPSALAPPAGRRGDVRTRR